MATIMPIAQVRERITDEHKLQNILLAHDGALEEIEKQKAELAALAGRFGDQSDLIAKQKRMIESLQTENEKLKAELAEIGAKHPEIAAARKSQLNKQIEQMRSHIEKAEEELASLGYSGDERHGP